MYRLETTVARQKLKELAGYSNDQWNMPSNSIIREEPYLAMQLQREERGEAHRGEGSVRSYIAVVSSCCEVSGSVQVMNATPMRRRKRSHSSSEERSAAAEGHREGV